jgi:hypothetical protein
VTDRTLGDLIDSLGVTLNLDDDDLVSDAIIITKIINANSEVSVSIGKSESLTWLDELGLLVAANDIVRSEGFTNRDNPGE